MVTRSTMTMALNARSTINGNSFCSWNDKNCISMNFNLSYFKQRMDRRAAIFEKICHSLFNLQWKFKQIKCVVPTALKYSDNKGFSLVMRNLNEKSHNHIVQNNAFSVTAIMKL